MPSRGRRPWWEWIAIYSFVWWAMLVIVAAYGGGWPEWWIIGGSLLLGLAHGVWGVK